MVLEYTKITYWIEVSSDKVRWEEGNHKTREKKEEKKEERKKEQGREGGEEEKREEVSKTTT